MGLLVSREKLIKPQYLNSLDQIVKGDLEVSVTDYIDDHTEKNQSIGMFVAFVILQNGLKTN